jgi:hypothetical protein
MLHTISQESKGNETTDIREGFLPRAIVREQTRRMWPVGLLMFLTFFFAGPVYLIMTSGIATDFAGPAASWFPIDNVLDSNAHTFFGMMLSLIAGVAAFRYMHSPAALSVVRAFPVSRGALFRGSFVSGLALIFAPFIACALMILPQAITDNRSSDWVIWTLSCLSLFLFTYAVSVLAGMVSGNTGAHFLTALIFNFAWLILYFMSVNTIQSHLYGVTIEGSLMDFAAYLHPYSYFSSVEGMSIFGMEVGEGAPYAAAFGIILYALLAAVISVFAFRLYLRFKAERAGESITARPVEHIFTYAVSLLGMSTGGTIFAMLDTGGPFYNTDWALNGYDPMNYVSGFFIAGSIVGALVGFMVATMILKKSARIFNLPSLRRFGIFAVAATVFIVCTVTNITGAETRVPPSNDVEAAAVGIYLYQVPPYKYATAPYDTEYIPIRGEGDIAILTDLHKKALADKAYIFNGKNDSDELNQGFLDGSTSREEMNIYYGLKNGSRESRHYELSGKYLTHSKDYARLLASDSVKEQMSIGNLIGYDKLSLPRICYGDTWDLDGNSASLDSDARAKFETDKDIAEFARLLDEDYKAMSAEDMLKPGKELFTLKLLPEGGKLATKNNLYGSGDQAILGLGHSIAAFSRDRGGDSFYLYYTVTEKNTKAVAWLKSKGIYDSIMKSLEELKTRRDGDSPVTETHVEVLAE